MKYLVFILALAFVFQANAQQRLIKFTKTNGATIVLNTDDVAFIFPVSTSQSTLVLGPSVHSVDVNEAVDTIINRSYGAFVRATEVYSRMGATSNRTVGISKAHIGDLKADAGSKTIVRVKNPSMNVVLSGAIADVFPLFVGESYFTRTDSANYIGKLGINVIKASGTLATDSLFLPAAPNNGDWVRVVYQTAVTALVVNGSGKTIVGTAATSASAGTTLQYDYFGAPHDVWIRTK